MIEIKLKGLVNRLLRTQSQSSMSRSAALRARLKPTARTLCESRFATSS